MIKKKLRAVIFDYGLTIGREYYFNRKHPRVDNWSDLIQEIVFLDHEFSQQWMVGKKNVKDIAMTIASRTGVDETEILTFLKDGCKSIAENEDVISLARKLAQTGIPIALVTLNFDIFNEILIPHHGYSEIFNVIINSCDYGTIDKTSLWPIAFNAMGSNISYGDCLLIEDRKCETDRFVALGGHAIQYTKTTELENEISKYEFEKEREYA